MVRVSFVLALKILVVLAMLQCCRAVPTALRTSAPELNVANLSIVKCRFYI